jgi:hypothetical protein
MKAYVGLSNFFNLYLRLLPLSVGQIANRQSDCLFQLCYF